jgi:2-C-methyl-D-erythritol 4-phosphate cytidylyltransferase/2-C-methyl-D-erythritol 2,4-cyclodiphosphate synthase
MPSTLAVLIVAAGRGERAGGSVPKQFRQVAGRPLLAWSAIAFANQADHPLIQFVIADDQESLFENTVPVDTAARKPVIGGPTRQDSVRNGLESLREANPDFVLIHDAARPLVSQGLINRVIDALRGGADAAVPLLPVADTLRRRENDGSWSLVARDQLHRAQTPQGFRFAAILNAHLAYRDQSVTDDMALAELAGLRIESVVGEESNLKVTSAEDFAMAEKLLEAARDIRTGMGYDAHRFTKGDHVWLGGVRIAHDRGLEGHSDADAALHALTDAILGALGAGDIGQHFPPSDERWRGAPSSKFLGHAAALVREAGGEIRHGDITIICESPKISPHREAMRARIAEILGLDVSRISVKATTTEGMGFTGRKEGLAAQAVATIRL